MSEMTEIKLPTIYSAQPILGAKHTYKKKELQFDYLTKKEFKEQVSEQNAKLVGSIKLSKQTNNKNVDAVVIDSNDCTYRFELIDKPEDGKDLAMSKGPVLGYIKVDENTYIEVKKSLFILIPIFFGILILGICLFTFLPSGDTPTDNPLHIAEGQDWDGNLPSNGDPDAKPASAESITIPGYADLYVSSEKPSVQLINPDGNTVYMVYSISYNDEVIYETDGAIPAGQMVEADLYNVFNGAAGTYDLTFKISTYDANTNAPCNGATQPVTLNIK